MLTKLKNTVWLQPLWWLSVLYVWFGAFYPFLFTSHDENPNRSPSLWLTAAYILLLVGGILLFREKSYFRGIYTVCRALQTLGLLAILLVNHISGMTDSWLLLTLISGLTVVPYLGMWGLQVLWLQIALLLFSLALTILANLKPKK